MKIVVWIKQVPARDSQLRIASAANWIEEADLTHEINEPDAYALEEALQLKEKHGGEVVVICAGSSQAAQTIREALAKTNAPVIALSPIIGTAAVSGPAANLMRAQGVEVSIAGVANAYQDFLDILVAHESDAEFAKSVRVGNVEIHCADILMRTTHDRKRVASTALSLARPEIIQE